jgi:hypothetical protein
MRERKPLDRAPEPVKPKSEIWRTDKWNASVEAEIAKQAMQPGWIQQNVLGATNGM